MTASRPRCRPALLSSVQLGRRCAAVTGAHRSPASLGVRPGPTVNEATVSSVVRGRTSDSGTCYDTVTFRARWTTHKPSASVYKTGLYEREACVVTARTWRRPFFCMQCAALRMETWSS